MADKAPVTATRRKVLITVCGLVLIAGVAVTILSRGSDEEPSGRGVVPLPPDPKSYIYSLAYSPSGRLVSGTEDGVIQEWDTRSGQPVLEFDTGMRGKTSLARDGMSAVVFFDGDSAASSIVVRGPSGWRREGFLERAHKPPTKGLKDTAPRLADYLASKGLYSLKASPGPYDSLSDVKVGPSNKYVVGSGYEVVPLPSAQSESGY